MVNSLLQANIPKSFNNSGAECSALTAGFVQPVVTLCQRTDAVLLGLDLVLNEHNAPRLIRDELKKQLHALLDTSSDETVWLKRIKFALTYPLSKYLRNPLPPKPDLVFEPSGSLRRWMKERFNAFNRKNTHLWYSWLQAKRSSLPASDEIIDSTYEKHLSTLTRVDPGDDKTIEDIMNMPIFVRLLDRIKAEVAKRMKVSKSFDTYMPSASACFEQTRTNGGQQGELQRLAEVKNFNDPWSVVSENELWSMKWSPKAIFKGQLRYNLVSETRVSAGWEEWQTLRTCHVGNQIFMSSFKPTKCTIQGILEPMKVRVISKGEALPYYMCKPLQVAMHSTLREMDPFRLIGRPFSPTDLIDLAQKAEPTDEWFSVDYSAATDGLSWKYSGAIFKKIIEDLDDEEKYVAMSVLGPHALHYPVQGRKDVIFKGMQQNGQLMGSILSFPILCLANLGVYLNVTTDFQKGWTDKERLGHVLINGDDMVYAANPILWDEHTEKAGKVGLEMSVGKAYRHKIYANINSTSVHYDISKLRNDREVWLNATPWQIDFLNAGLFYGQRKVQVLDKKENSFLRTESEAKWVSPLLSDEKLIEQIARVKISQEQMDNRENLVSSLNEVLGGSLPGKQSRLLKAFMQYHKKTIHAECLGVISQAGKTKLFTRNLFLPVSLGGMGVEKPLNFKTKIKSIQVKFAQLCLKKASLGGAVDISYQLPMPGIEVAEVDDIQSVPWVRRVAPEYIFGKKFNQADLKKEDYIRMKVYPYLPHSIKEPMEDILEDSFFTLSPIPEVSVSDQDHEVSVSDHDIMGVFRNEVSVNTESYLLSKLKALGETYLLEDLQD